jgi:hypothetical protein
VALLVLAHVEADHVVLGVEQGGRQRAGQLRLPDPGRPEEDERPDGPAGVLDAGAGPDDGVGHHLHRLVLPDDALVQDLVEAQQLLPLALLEPADRDAGPPRHDQRDLVLRHDLAQQPSTAEALRELLLLGPELALQLGQQAVLQLGRPVEVVPPLGLLGLPADALDLLAQGLHALEPLPLRLPLGPHRVGLAPQVRELLAQLLEPGLAGGIALLGQGGLLDLQPGHPPRQLVELRRHGVDLGPQHGAGLVDEVDGLVGQEPVADVAVAEHHGRDEGVVLDRDAVEHLQALAQAPEDRDRVLHGRLVDEHRLEAALEGGVLLDVHAVLGEGGGTDHVELAAGEHRLEHVPGVHRSLGRAGADHRVQLVDEQQDAALGRLDLVQHGLQPLLELAPVLGAGHQRADVEGEDRPVAEALGHVAAHDPLGETLDDGRLADAGVADEDGVVLGLAGQDLDHTADLRVPPDDGVEPAVPGVRDQVAAVLLQGLVGDLRHRRGHPLVAPDRGERLQEPVAGQALLPQAPSRRCLGPLVEQRDDQVLDRDVVVLQPLGLAFGRVEQPGQPLGHEHLARRGARPGHPGPAGQVVLDGLPQSVGVGARLPEQPGHEAVGLVEEGQQQVLAVHLGLPEPQRDRLRRVDRLL